MIEDLQQVSLSGDHILLVNDDRTLLVRIWPSGEVEAATRGNSWETWGPPIHLSRER